MTKKSEQQLPNFLTVPEGAEVIRVAPRTVWRLIADGELKVHRFGRKVLIAEEDLADLIRRCRR